MLKRISEVIPEVCDRYMIDELGNLYTNNGDKILKDCLDRKGYVRNGLKLKTGGQKNYLRHRLVMLCFKYRNDHIDYQVNHIDCDKTNNHIDNLEWCTNEENIRHAFKNNLISRPSTTYSKLTEDNVKEIIDILLNDNILTYKEIGEKFGVARETIVDIHRKRTWKNFTKDIEFPPRFND